MSVLTVQGNSRFDRPNEDIAQAASDPESQSTDKNVPSDEASVPPGLFNPNATGRITPVGNFTDFGKPSTLRKSIWQVC